MMGEMGETLGNVGGGQVGSLPGRKPENNKKSTVFFFENQYLNGPAMLEDPLRDI